MALYYNLFNSELHNEHEVHIGEKDKIKQMNDYGRQCILVQADCDELERIEELFTNIPFVKGKRVMRWTGETAAFIAMNFH